MNRDGILVSEEYYKYLLNKTKCLLIFKRNLLCHFSHRIKFVNKQII